MTENYLENLINFSTGDDATIATMVKRSVFYVVSEDASILE